MAAILIVEDEVDLCNLIRTKLEAEGHSVLQAFDGWQLFAWLRCIVRISLSWIGCCLDWMGWQSVANCGRII